MVFNHTDGLWTVNLSWRYMADIDPWHKIDTASQETNHQIPCEYIYIHVYIYILYTYTDYMHINVYIDVHCYT